MPYKINTIPALIDVNVHIDNHAPAWIRRVDKKRQETYSYSQVAKAANQLQKKLIDFGIVQGDVVGLLASNGPEWGVAAIALWRMGAIVAPIHYANSVDDIDQQVQLLQPKLVLTYRASVSFKNEMAINMDDLVGEDYINIEPIQAKIMPDDEAVRIYTSGSTGNSKMVRLSHQNLSVNAQQGISQLNVCSTDKFLSLLPLSHVFELTAGFLVPLSKGSSIVIPRVLAAKEIFTAMSENGVTVIIAVPRFFRTIYQNIMQQTTDGGLLTKFYLYLLAKMPVPLRKKMNGPIRKKIGTKTRIWVSGGAALDPDISRGFHKLGFSLVQGYGLTETSPVLAVQDEFDASCHGVGKLLPGVEIKIEGACEEDKCGEVWVKGPNIMLGYTDENANKEAFQDGWFKTGDLGYLDDKQRLILTGRKKRLIVTDAGKNVYPEDIEVKIERFPRVNEAAVLECNEKPVVVISIANLPEQTSLTAKKDQSDVSNAIEVAQEILAEKRQYAKKILSEYNKTASKHNHVTRYAVVDELPHTPLGKIAYKELIQVFVDNEA